MKKRDGSSNREAADSWRLESGNWKMENRPRQGEVRAGLRGGSAMCLAISAASGDSATDAIARAPGAQCVCRYPTNYSAIITSPFLTQVTVP